MATIGSLIVNLIANTSVFDKKLNSSKGTLKGFVGSIATTQRQVMNFAKGLAAAAGVAGLTMMVKKTMDTIDATAKLSDRLQMATEDVIALQHAANQSGMDTEEMNKSLETFVRRLGEARSGSGSAAETLKRLGLSVKELVANNQIENLKILADRINQLPTAADKAAVAYDLFGKQGQQMLNLLADGSSGIDAFRSEAEKLGITFSRLDAAEVEAAGDAIDRAKAAMTGLVQMATVEMAPSIAAAADKLTEFATSGENMRTKMVTGLKVIAMGFALVGNMINVVKAALHTVAGILLAVATTIAEIFAKILRLIEAAYNKVVELQNKLAESKLGVKLGIDKMSQADLTSTLDAYVEGLATETGEMFKAAWSDITDLPTMKVDEWFADLEKRTEAIKANLEERAARNRAMANNAPPTEMSDNAKRIQEMLDALDLEYSMLGRISEERERALELAKFQKIVQEEYVNDIAKQNELMQQYAEKLDKLAAGKRGIAAFQSKLAEWGEQATNIWANLGDIATNALDGISASLTELIVKGKADFRALAVSIMSDILQMMIKAQIARAVMAFLPGFGGTGMAAAGASSANMSGAAAAGSSWVNAPIMHTGRFGRSRSFPVATFSGAPRLHDGLAADEFPAILQQGEKVTSKVDAARERTAVVEPVNPNVNVKIINVTDKKQMLEFVGSPEGEKTIINALKRNKGIIAGMLR